MKARNLLWISVVNIFLLLLVSVLMEYADLNGRFKQIQNIFSTSTETAIVSSTASEEFFSENFAALMSSYATDSAKNSIAGGISIFSDSEGWVSGNVYHMAYFYNQYGRFPTSQAEYNQRVGSLTTKNIYEWLYGKTGSVYNNLAWANSRTKLYRSSLWSGVTTDRTPTSNFSTFYNSIGNKLMTNAYVKVRSNSSYNIALRTIPVLTQMGLNLDSTYNSGSTITTDYLNSVTHFGKSNSGIADTQYYLTPNSLGVTYVPLEVFKPVFLAHFEQLVRFNKVKSTVDYDGSKNDFKDATGCLDTDVYVNGTRAVHTDSSSVDILNDGQVEYDLSTLKTKVDYFVVDFYDNANYDIVNRIEGATSQYNASGRIEVNNRNTLTNLPDRLEALDTTANANRNSYSGTRLVAKVSVKMKIHVPYKSSILQWFRQLNDTDGKNHYDIRLYDESNDSVEFESNGVWFYYTTYTAVTR